MKKLTLLTALLIVCSCSSRHSSSALSELGNEVPLAAQEYTDEIVMPNPLSIAMAAGKLLLFQGVGEDAILVVNPEDGTLQGRFGLRGVGPGEFTYPIYWGSNVERNELYLFDLNLSCLRTYSCWEEGDSIRFSLEKERRMEAETSVHSGVVIGDSLSVASALFNSPQPLVLLDKNLKPSGYVETFPKQGDSPDMLTYAGVFSSRGNRFVYGMENLGYLACYHCKGSEVRKEWEVFLEEPRYKGEKLDINRLKQGFLDVRMAENYIFCNYSGQVFSPEDPGFFGHHILVFNHRGKLVKNFKLDRRIAHMTVSPDEKTVYAVANEPDVNIVRFHVGDFL